MVAVAAPDRRRAILEAALDRFVEAGVAATTIDDIRRASGASVGSIYHRFADKEAIAAAVYADGIARYQDAFLAELRRHASAEAGIRATVARHLRWNADNRRLAWFLHHERETADVDDELRTLNRDAFAEVRAWLAPHVHYGAIRDLDATVQYALWLGPSQEYCRHWLAGRARRSPRAVAPELGEAAWNALKGANP
jgi:AcrR family transcriptional regulator